MDWLNKNIDPLYTILDSLNKILDRLYKDIDPLYKYIESLNKKYLWFGHGNEKVF